MIDFEKLVQDKTVEIYDANSDLVNDIHSKGATRVTAFDRDATDSTVLSGAAVRPYRALLEAVDCVTSVCVLNNAAIKILVAMYPSAPKHVLVRLRFHSAWIFGILGLIRRLIFGFVRIEGITSLPKKKGKGKTYWLVLEQSDGDFHSIPVLPKAVGIQSFLNWLEKKKVNYVVLRFYEKLPKLHREAGDLDILVADKDKKKVEKFLKEQEHLTNNDSGDIRVGIHSVSGEKGTIPYYPPVLASAMLNKAMKGPAGSKIPEPLDALHAFIYHCLYHSKKGYSSGIPSSLNDFMDKHPENDYAGHIKKMAKTAGVSVGSTMEELDEYMAQVGWRPKLDTLSKMSWTNAWVKDRFFSAEQQKEKGKGLSVFILREWIVDGGYVNDVLKYVEEKGYTILRKKKFNKEEKQRAFEQLRGGTWGANEYGDTTAWMPAYAIVVIDEQCAKMPATYSEGFEKYRIRQLKEALRSKFDDERSSMHSTDNTHESWEYIEVCFPDEIKDIKKEVKEHTSSSKFSGWVHAFSPKYIRHSFKQSLRRFFIKNFLE